jgi:hypothetical protein
LEVEERGATGRVGLHAECEGEAVVVDLLGSEVEVGVVAGEDGAHWVVRERTGCALAGGADEGSRALAAQLTLSQAYPSVETGAGA